MDTAPSDIRAVEFTTGRDGDSTVLPDLLEQISENEQIGSVIANGAYDTRRCHIAIIARDTEVIIPVRRNGRLWKDDGSPKLRNEILRSWQRFGRSLWKRITQQRP